MLAEGPIGGEDVPAREGRGRWGKESSRNHSDHFRARDQNTNHHKPTLISEDKRESVFPLSMQAKAGNLSPRLVAAPKFKVQVQKRPFRTESRPFGPTPKVASSDCRGSYNFRLSADRPTFRARHCAAGRCGIPGQRSRRQVYY